MGTTLMLHVTNVTCYIFPDWGWQICLFSNSLPSRFAWAEMNRYPCRRNGGWTQSPSCYFVGKAAWRANLLIAQGIALGGHGAWGRRAESAKALIHFKTTALRLCFCPCRAMVCFPPQGVAPGWLLLPFQGVGGNCCIIPKINQINFALCP